MRCSAVNPPMLVPASRSWQAQLALGFANDAGVTRLTERAHSGPLRVQKPLYPEGQGICHAIVVHPPGGVAGGDELLIRMKAGAGSAALVTTPGAGKWYKANGRTASQAVAVAVDEGASLEWLPQETIVFDAADVQLRTEVELAAGACYMGSEVLCFGRTASGEAFRSGRLAQHTTIRSEGRLIWFEQGRLVAGGHAMQSPLGLAGKTVCATFLAGGRSVPAALLAQVREQVAGMGGVRFGITQLKSVVAARYLGDSSEQAKDVMAMVWRALRPAFAGREAMTPRIWNT